MHHIENDIFTNDSEEFVYRPDRSYREVQQKIKNLYEEDKKRVYYVRQLQVFFEKEHFHWITANALKGLEKIGDLEKVPIKRKCGTSIHFYHHKQNRYPKREINKKIKIVNEYSQEHIMKSCGQRAENLFCTAFSLHGFMPVERDTRSYKKKVWEETDHNLDFIFKKDDISYGCEIKNSLSYIEKEEFEIKIKMCKHLNIRPLFIMRMAPKTYINEIINLGGYALIFKYQLYDPSQKELVDIIKKELELPVDCPRAIYEGTMKKLNDRHKKYVNSKKKSQKQNNN